MPLRHVKKTGLTAQTEQQKPLNGLRTGLVAASVAYVCSHTQLYCKNTRGKNLAAGWDVRMAGELSASPLSCYYTPAPLFARHITIRAISDRHEITLHQ